MPIDQFCNARTKDFKNLFKHFVKARYNQCQFDYLVTPGGFLTFDFPKPLNKQLNIHALQTNHVDLLEAV